MEIVLKEIAEDNFYDVCLLTTNESGVPTFDEEFLCGNAVSIAESKYYPLLNPQAIYKEETPIGFILSGPYFKDPGNFWVLRYMIDYRYQGHGYGRKAFLNFIEQVKSDKNIKKIYIGLAPDNKSAHSLYTSIGFQFTGELKDGEEIYTLSL